jgi:hypothetical protein
VNSKIVSVKEFDTEYEYKELNDRDGRVVLPAVILDPESEYLIFHILGRMKVTFSDHWEILRDLLANEGLCEYDSASLPPYLQLRKNFVRISAKVVCDAYGTTERQRKNLLRSVREFLAIEGVMIADKRRAKYRIRMPLTRQRIASGARSLSPGPNHPPGRVEP